jgi:hypothetical protein
VLVSGVGPDGALVARLDASGAVECITGDKQANVLQESLIAVSTSGAVLEASFSIGETPGPRSVLLSLPH